MKKNVFDPALTDVALLSKAGLQATSQRLELVACLRRGGDRHICAAELHKEAAASGANISLATVYNTLNALALTGCLRQVHVRPGLTFFDTRTENHPHFYFSEEGRLTDAPQDSFSIERLPTPPEGTEIIQVSVVVRLRSAER